MARALLASLAPPLTATTLLNNLFFETLIQLLVPGSRSFRHTGWSSSLTFVLAFHHLATCTSSEETIIFSIHFRVNPRADRTCIPLCSLPSWPRWPGRKITATFSTALFMAAQRFWTTLTSGTSHGITRLIATRLPEA